MRNADDGEPDMNDTTNPNDASDRDDIDPGGVDRDVLISRVIDGEASPEDWRELRAIARVDQALWGDLATAQEHASLLRSAMGSAIERASVTLPGLHASPAGQRVIRWGGWAVAAMVAIAFIVVRLGDEPTDPQRMTAGSDASIHKVSTPLTPDEALDAYIREGRATGRVLDSNPRIVVIESQVDPSGRGVEVIYLRQIMERALVEDVYRVMETDAGELVRTRLNRLPRSGDF